MVASIAADHSRRFGRLDRVSVAPRSRARRTVAQAAAGAAARRDGRPHDRRSCRDAHHSIRHGEIQIVARAKTVSGEVEVTGEVGMSWERHKNALIEAAASNDALPLDLRAHLDDCATCRAAFEEERRLLAAIDSSLRGAANAPVPPLLLPTVRRHLAQEDAAHANAKRSPSANWMYLAATAALILALVPLLRQRRVSESQ